MRFWWVNQNQTYRHEVPGGYLWSPKRKANGNVNPFYETMREVAPGDFVFSFADTLIRAFGIARSFAYEAPKPIEFGSTGRNWEQIGWRVDVSFSEVPTHFRPADWMSKLAPLLPSKYSPLLSDGRGVQSIYLAEVPLLVAQELGDLIGHGVGAIVREGRSRDVVISENVVPNAEHLLWEEHLRKDVEEDLVLTDTEKQAIVLARRGQGLFRSRVQQIESRCRITSVERAEHLRASHCKPWRDASNEERLAGENGLLLTPSIDHLFDRGFISFEGGGRLLISPVADRPSLARMGVPVDRAVEVGAFTSGQSRFLEYHRDQVFLESRLKPSRDEGGSRSSQC